MKLTKAQRELLSKIGRANAKAQSAAMTPEQRKQRARKASLARWTKTKATCDKYQIPSEKN